MAKITFTVEINEEADGSFWASVKELPGCFASGFDMDELKEATNEAIQMWLPDGIALGNPKWVDDDEKTPRGGSKQKKRPSAKRKMLVCA